MVKTEFFKSVIYNRNSVYDWILVWLVRSLKPSHKEALKTPLLCEDKSDLTCPN